MCFKVIGIQFRMIMLTELKLFRLTLIHNSLYFEVCIIIL